jgi:hypothetical protein
MDRGVYYNLDMGMTAWGSACGALVIMVKFYIVETEYVEERDAIQLK